MTKRDLLNLRKFVAPEFIFGTGARTLAGQYCNNLGARRVLLVTDAGLINAGWADDVKAILKRQKIKYVTFSKLTSNPKDHEVLNGFEVYRDENCNVILAVGGGSVMDCAKGIGIVSSNGGHILDYEGIDEISQPCPPLICIPTTAGSSADVSQFAIITDTKRSIKIAIVSKAVVPDVALIDPETTLTMDRELTAHTGLDALAHAIESLVSNAASPITELHALEAARLVNKHLLHTLEHPSNMEHRTAMMLASLQAGLAFSNASLGMIHAMAHSLGGLYNLPHGECNAILLPYVVDFNFESARTQYEKLGRAMDLDLEGMKQEERKLQILATINYLKEKAGVTMRLEHMGISRDDLPRCAFNAMHDICMATNPRVPTQSEIEKLYEQAY